MRFAGEYPTSWVTNAEEHIPDGRDLILAASSAFSAAFAETLQEALVSAYTTNPTLLAERARAARQ